MATLKVKVKNSRFVDYNGVEVKLFTPTKVKGNGWECNIDENGNISCVAQQYYDGERHTMKLNIKNGRVKLLLKVGHQMPKVLKVYELEYDNTDGVIGLPSGHIDKRRAYFRDEKFQKFMDEHGLAAVNHESANGVFGLHEEFLEGESIFKEEIEDTDGTTETISKKIKEIPDNGENSFLIYQHIRVSHATWAIKKITKGMIVKRILYTSDNPKKILNLPKI